MMQFAFGLFIILLSLQKCYSEIHRKPFFGSPIAPPVPVKGRLKANYNQLGQHHSLAQAHPGIVRKQTTISGVNSFIRRQSARPKYNKFRNSHDLDSRRFHILLEKPTRTHEPIRPFLPLQRRIPKERQKPQHLENRHFTMPLQQYTTGKISNPGGSLIRMGTDSKTHRLSPLTEELIRPYLMSNLLSDMEADVALKPLSNQYIDYKPWSPKITTTATTTTGTTLRHTVTTPRPTAYTTSKTTTTRVSTTKFVAITTTSTTRSSKEPAVTTPATSRTSETSKSTQKTTVKVSSISVQTSPPRTSTTPISTTLSSKMIRERQTTIPTSTHKVATKVAASSTSTKTTELTMMILPPIILSQQESEMDEVSDEPNPEDKSRNVVNIESESQTDERSQNPVDVDQDFETGERSRNEIKINPNSELRTVIKYTTVSAEESMPDNLAVKEQGREGEALWLSCPLLREEPGSSGSKTVWTSPEKLVIKAGQRGRHHIQPNGALIIESLKSVDEGVYICSVGTKNGTVAVTIEDCAITPCLNSGECEDLDGESGTKMYCRCPDSYEGRYCENKKNLWILLIPFVGSGLVVVAIIAAVVRYTCWNKTKQKGHKSSQLNHAAEGDPLLPKEIVVQPEPLNFSDQRFSQVLPKSSMKPSVRPPVPTTSSGFLPQYDVETQYGSAAYWPDRRFSYTKYQDRDKTQTGQAEAYLPTGTEPWGYASEETQVPEEGRTSLLLPPDQLYNVQQQTEQDWINWQSQSDQNLHADQVANFQNGLVGQEYFQSGFTQNNQPTF